MHSVVYGMHITEYVRGTIAESFIFRVTAQSLYWLKHTAADWRDDTTIMGAL